MINAQMLKRLRKQAKLTQQDLADRVGTHRVTISQVESEKRRIDAELLESWLEACGVSLQLVEDQPTGLSVLHGHAERLSPTQLDTLVNIARLLPYLKLSQVETIEILLEGWAVRNL